MDFESTFTAKREKDGVTVVWRDYGESAAEPISYIVLNTFMLDGREYALLMIVDYLMDFDPEEDPKVDDQQEEPGAYSPRYATGQFPHPVLISFGLSFGTGTVYIFLYKKEGDGRETFSYIDDQVRLYSAATAARRLLVNGDVATPLWGEAEEA